MSFIEGRRFADCKKIDKNAVPVLLLKSKQEEEDRLICYVNSDEGQQKIIFKPSEYEINIIPFKLPKQRVAVCIFGKSGSGKSSACASLIRNSLKYDRSKQENLLVTAAEDPDEAFDDVTKGMNKDDKEKYAVRILDTDDAMEKDVKANELTDRNIIFDDYNESGDPELDSYVQHLLSALLERSRKLNTSLYILLHKVMAGHSTTRVLNESESFLSFPKRNFNATAKLFKDYCDMDKKQLDQIKRLNGDGLFTICYYQRSPSYLISNDIITMF